MKGQGSWLLVLGVFIASGSAAPAGPRVDLVDFAAFANHWLETGCSPPGWCDGADINRSSDVAATDLSALTSGWLQYSSGTSAGSAGSVRQKICLNGVWEFLAAGTSIDEIPQGQWRNMRVPSSWVKRAYDNFTISSEDRRSPHAWFKRSFYVPQAWQDGRCVKLLFLGIDWVHKVYINNGQADVEAHSADSMRLCFEVDIKDHITYGADNTVTVLVHRQDANDFEAGIIRSVYLTSYHPVHIDYAHVITSVRDLTLTARVLVRNEDAVPHRVRVSAVVKDNDSSLFNFVVADDVEVPPDAQSGGNSQPLERTILWNSPAFGTPIFWGFGEYGQPHLYHLQTVLYTIDEEPTVADETYDRFGFRQFRAAGTEFLFNEKRYFIRGDLISRQWPFVENPSFITAFYQAMRQAQVSFQRLHSCDTNNFDTRGWFEVADEFGHLVESQLEADNIEAKLQDYKSLWKSYVNYHFNHPSLVMWCLDNEHFNIPNPDDPNADISDCIASISEPNVAPYNELATYVRGLDETRVLDFHHGWALWLAVKRGWFDPNNLMTFNVHPYGDLPAQIDLAKTALADKEAAFDGSIPVLVGELFDSPRWVDLINEPVLSYGEASRRGEVFYEDLLDVYEYGVAGSIWCSLERTGYIGHKRPDPKYPYMFAGPWSDHAVELTPEGELAGEKICKVKVHWPSLSGEGTKAEFIRINYTTRGQGGGCGHNINWFDPGRPIFAPSITYARAKRAYMDVQRQEQGYAELGPDERANEILVCFGISGEPREGAYVYLVPLDGQSPPASAVTTDEKGTAWFRIWDTGSYRVETFYKETVYEALFEVQSRPKLTSTPGYAHLIPVTVGQIDNSCCADALAGTIEFTEHAIRQKGELLINGDMEYWIDDGILAEWSDWDASDVPVKEEVIKKIGSFSAKLVGDSAQILQPMLLRPGKTYTISGWIRKGSGDPAGCGKIAIQGVVKEGDKDLWKWVWEEKGSEMPYEWTYIEKDVTAPIADQPACAIFCVNDSMGEGGFCHYDGVSVCEQGP